MGDNLDGLTLVLGGARSGKSAFAERLAGQAGQRVLYLATAEARDDEMIERVRLHKQRRPADWSTIEEQVDPAGALRSTSRDWDIVLLDCVSIWMTNCLLNVLDGPEAPDASDVAKAHGPALEAVQRLLDWRVETSTHLILVSTEVGLGIIPAFPLGRIYRDLLGQVNQWLAREASHVHFLVAGLAMDLK